jgi:hypothetical protein
LGFATHKEKEFKFDGLARFFPSFRRKPESGKTKTFWTPAFAGVTVWGTSREIVGFRTFLSPESSGK